MIELPIVETAGTPAEMGLAHGRAVRDRVQAFVDQRVRAMRVYLRERGVTDLEALRRIGAGCLERLRDWDREAWIEHAATAEGAGVDAIDLYTAGNMTDVRDVLVLGAPRADAEGCTTALVGPALSAQGVVIASQTWDLNPTDIDYVVAVHRRPAEGVETWAISCAGCQTVTGMNARGVAVGTTNIKTSGSRLGIPYLSLLHRALRSRDRTEAERVVATAPRAAAHTYWFADAGGACDIETTPDGCERRDLADGSLCRTNHCLAPGHQKREGEPPSASSRARLARAGAVLGLGRHSVESLKALYADRSDGIDSINRRDEDQQGTSTIACLIAVPVRRELHVCRGPADRGRWVQLPFATPS